MTSLTIPEIREKLKSGAVAIEGASHTAPWLQLETMPIRLTLRVGKRAKIAVIE